MGGCSKHQKQQRGKEMEEEAIGRVKSSSPHSLARHTVITALSEHIQCHLRAGLFFVIPLQL